MFIHVKVFDFNIKEHIVEPEFWISKSLEYFINSFWEFNIDSFIFVDNSVKLFLINDNSLQFICNFV